MRPPGPDSMPARRRQTRGLDAAGPHHRPGEDLPAVGEHDPIGLDLVHLHTELELHVPVFQRLPRVGVHPVGERGEHHRSRIDDVDLRRADPHVAQPLRDQPVEHVGERAGGLDAGRAGTDDHEVQRTLVDQLRVPVRSFEHREQARPEALGVVERVEGNACSSAPGVPKKFASPPIASTR